MCVGARTHLYVRARARLCVCVGVRVRACVRVCSCALVNNVYTYAAEKIQQFTACFY